MIKIKNSKYAVMLITALSVGGFVEAMTLDNVIERAMKNHPEIIELTERVKKSNYNIDKNKAGHYPTLDVSAMLGNQRTSSVATRNPIESEEKTNKRNLTIDGTEINFKQNIFNGFLTTNKVKESEYLYLSAKDDLVYGMNSLKMRIIEAYYNVLKMKEILDLTEGNRDTHEETKRKVEKLNKQGLINNADLAKIIGRTARSRSMVIEKKNDLNNAIAEYEELTNFEVSQLKKPEDVEFDIHSLDAALKKLVDNPKLVSYANKINGAVSAYNSAKGKFYPKFDFEVNYTRNNNLNGVIDLDKDTTVKLSVNYNLSNGWTDKSELRKSELNAQLVRRQGEELYSELVSELTVLWNDYEKLSSEKVILTSSMKESFEVFKFYTKQFDIGQRELLDLIDAANDLHSSRISLVNNTYDEAIGKYKILHSFGNFVIPTSDVMSDDGGVIVKSDSILVY